MTEQRSKAGLVAVYLTVFLDLLGFGIIIPLMPFAAREFGATGVWMGALMTAYSGAQFLGAPIIGRLSDTYGRRPLLLATLAGSCASLLLMGFAQSLGVLLAARLLAGLFGGSISAAQAYIADVTAPAERAKFMGLLGAAIGAGFVFGPALGAALSGYGLSGAAFAAAGLAAFNLILAAARLKESRVPGRAGLHKAGIPALGRALGQSGIRPVLIASFLATFGLVSMESTYALLGADRYAMDPKTLGLVFTAIGVVVVIVQGGLIGRLAKRFGEGRIAVTGPLVMAVGLAAIPAASTLGESVAALLVMAVGQALSSPALSSLLSLRAGKDEQGGVIGVGQSMAALARAVGPLCAGFLYDRAQAGPYVLGAAACLLACAAVFSLRGAGAAAVRHVPVAAE